MVLWVGLCPQKRYDEALTPTGYECDSTGKWGPGRGTQVQRWSLGSLQEEGKVDTETHRRRPCQGRNRQGVMRLQTKERQGRWAMPGARAEP